MNRRIIAPLAGLCILVAAAARADIADTVNGIRAGGCEGKVGVGAPLRSSRELQEVAREWSKGGRLQDAIARIGYRIVSSSSMHIEGASDKAVLTGILARNYCNVILEPSLTEIGAFQHDLNLWIVVARPFSAPATRDARDVSVTILDLVNQARARPRKCGRTEFPAAAALRLAPALRRAAMAHATDMAANEFLEHEGSDGSHPADRVSRTGYRWHAVGENIAAGALDAQTVVQNWLDSPHHCANIMSAQYRDMGVAYVVDPKSKAGIYWAQVFASPAQVFARP